MTEHTTFNLRIRTFLRRTSESWGLSAPQPGSNDDMIIEAGTVCLATEKQRVHSEPAPVRAALATRRVRAA